MKTLLKGLLFLVLAGFIAVAAALIYGTYLADELEAQNPIEELVAAEMSDPQYLPLEQIPLFLQDSTIAVEDDSFYQHGGINPFSLLRAVVSQLIPVIPDSGGSTITQQVVKNLYQHFNGNFAWKLTEIALAFRLEGHYTKQEILALYLNLINYGDDHIGIHEAANGYFNVEPLGLNDAECSLLAGIPQSPSNFQLSNHASNAKAKQKIVLKALVRNGYITQGQAQELYAMPIEYFADGIWNVLEGSQLALS